MGFLPPHFGRFLFRTLTSIRGRCRRNNTLLRAGIGNLIVARCRSRIGTAAGLNTGAAGAAATAVRGSAGSGAGDLGIGHPEN